MTSITIDGEHRKFVLIHHSYVCEVLARDKSDTVTWRRLLFSEYWLQRTSEELSLDEFTRSLESACDVLEGCKSEAIYAEECVVTGVKYAATASEVCAGLKNGARLEIRAEPDNPHDAQAQKVVYKGARLGYIPKARLRNVQLAMQHGKAFAKVLGPAEDYGLPSVRIAVLVKPSAAFKCPKGDCAAVDPAEEIVAHLQAVREITKDSFCKGCHPPSCMGCAWPDCAPDTVGGMVLRSLAMLDNVVKDSPVCKQAVRDLEDKRDAFLECESYTKELVNFLKLHKALGAWSTCGRLIPASWYTVLPLVSTLGTNRAEVDIPNSLTHGFVPNDAFRLVKLPNEANGFAVFTGRCLTFICLCRTHDQAQQMVRMVPSFHHHPGTLKLDEKTAWGIVRMYLDGAKMTSIEERSCTFGHQEGMDGLGECHLGEDGGVDFAYMRCNSREGFVPCAIPPILDTPPGRWKK